MNSFDSSLKYLVQRQPGDFISFGLGSEPVEVLQPIDLALPVRGRDLDGGFLITVRRERRIAHLEYHRRHQRLEELALDVAEAQLRLFRREELPVISQVWDLYGNREDPLLEDRIIE